MQRNEKVLCDAGPLIALYDPGEPAHAVCRAALANLSGRPLTTWPVVTEAMHLLGRVRRHGLLWELILRGGLGIEDIQPGELPRMHQLVQQYSDLPMDLADASLVALAERLNLRKIFTLDRHFQLYRARHTRSFDIFP